MAPDYIPVAEVAKLLNVSPKTVARWSTEGKVPYVRTLGGHRRYSRAVINSLAEQLGIIERL